MRHGSAAPLATTNNPNNPTPMAQAIETREAGPGRIRAKAARGARTFTVPDEMGNGHSAHQWAAQQLCARFVAEDVKHHGTEDAGRHWRAPFVTGCLPSGHYAHVFTDK